MQKNFTKWHGCGNDFIFFIDMEEKLTDLGGLATRLCDRHFGIGADGIIIVLPAKKPAHDFRMRIINLDGSEAEMCGNGIRCFAQIVYENGLTNKTHIRIETGAGTKTAELNIEDGKVKDITIDMGEPILSAPDIPVDGYGTDRVIHQPITVGGKEFFMTCVSMGNPHAVVFVEKETDVEEIETIGASFEIHKAFPARTNTEFCYVRDASHIRMRVWERGAKMTLACGTGTCAAMVAAVLEGRVERKAEIEIDGGILQLEWRETNNHIYMTGPAKKVFDGVLA